MPNYQPIDTVVWLPQNWTAEQRDWFHHADQGTQTFGIPYEWFIALEQPPFSSTTSGLLSDPLYLDRYGFIPDTTHTDKGELPIGFAHGGQILDISGNSLRNPQTDAEMTSLGFTCAACHTGRLTYQRTTILFDGGPALTNVRNFQKAVGLSIVYTHLMPWRFSRFADRVLGFGASDEAKSNLRKQFDAVYGQVTEVAKLERSVKSKSVDEGFTRLDALSRIGNTVFALDLDHHENFVAYSAPVHFPRIWDASWFEWVQYNGSIQQPMTRNAGEALGVRATVTFPVANQLPTSSVQVNTLFQLEQLLAGNKPPTAENRFTGLTSPKWPDKTLPPVNTKLASEGAILYQAHCKGCHLPPTSDSDFWTARQWSPVNAEGERYLNLNMIDIAHVGTDPAQAEDMKNRTVAIPTNLAITNDSGQIVSTSDFGNALRQVVSGVVNRWYDRQVPPVSPTLRDKMNGFRPDGIRALLQYKARPLDGVWATPPYLHNGSVPNLYALLSPVAERPTVFYLGNREYDPINVGYRTEKFSGGFRLDTSIRGNSNSGHEFKNGSGKGIIGPLLTPNERRALIEYLKTL